MKIFIAVAVLLALSGCGQPAEQWKSAASGDLKKVQGLEDCRATTIDTGASPLYVIRCPNSTVSTTRTGKNPVRTITEDGVEYEAKEK